MVCVPEVGVLATFTVNIRQPQFTNIAVFKTPRQTEALKGVHDTPLNALEMARPIRNDSAFFSNLNQMSLKRGFDEFWQRGAQTTRFGTPSLALQF